MCRHAASIIVKMWLPVYLGTHGQVGSAVAAMLLMYLLEETWLKASTFQTAWGKKTPPFDHLLGRRPIVRDIYCGDTPLV